jgi:acetyl-CoA carboxylase biotin carboxylase subunit
MRIHRLLIANRGEIAVRILRTAHRLGIETVLATSDADLESTAARLADRTVRLGPAPAPASYLDVAAVMEAARRSGADAVHPGYGFLAENPALVRACESAGLTFVGPTAAQLEAVGNKLRARHHAVAAGIPVLPGAELTLPGAELTLPGAELTLPGAELTPPADGIGRLDGTMLADGTTLADVTPGLGWPLLVKAVGGGGGRGMQLVGDAAELGAALQRASAQAQAAFGDPRVYLERYVASGRHVEVQLLGDGERVIHLGTRDCSVQRRYQKLVEEAPALGLDPDLHEQVLAAGVRFGEHLGYRGLGTVEFLVEPDRAGFWLLEMNARIQVEHPVTEAITGLDLVAEQLRVAEGRPLRLAQRDVTFTGHAVECRINAEDWRDGFRPHPGTVTAVELPAGPGVRVDTHLQAGAQVPPYYDSLLAKLVTHGADRARALDLMAAALDNLVVTGVPTNAGLHAELVADAQFRAGGVDTGYLPRFLADQATDRAAALGAGRG